MMGGFFPEDKVRYHRVWLWKRLECCDDYAAAWAPGQVAAVVGLLEIMLDPLARTLAAAPYDDEP